MCAMAAATFLVKDIQTTEKVFLDNCIRFRKVNGLLAVDPHDACGAHLYFKQA